MNIRPADPTVVVHFSAAKVERVDAFDDVLVGFDGGGHIVDVTVHARRVPARLDLVDEDRDAIPARVTYDASVDAMSVDLDSSPYEGSDEIMPGVIVDRDVDGFVRGLEFLNVSSLFSSEAMAGVRKHAILL